MKYTTDLIGTLLPNGAKIIAVCEFRQGDGTALGVVLADASSLFESGRHKYVTWEFYRGDLRSTSHGHYYEGGEEADDYADAVSDYIDRCKYNMRNYL